MKTVKRIIGVWVCLSISMYGLPAFAVADASASKTELSDAAMAAAVGGSMHAEILNTGQHEGDMVTALVAVGATCCSGFAYSLEAIDFNGNLLRTLASGNIDGGQAKVISGTRLASDLQTIFRVKLTFTAIPSIAALDTYTSFASGGN